MSTSRTWVLALVVAAGCAQADGNGLSFPVPDMLALVDAAPDFSTTTPPPSDLAMTLDMPTDMSTSIQVCDLHKVRVNEVQTQGTASATDEFIELYNPCTAAVSLNGATVVYRSSTATADSYILWTFTTETIPAQGYFVLANTNFTGTANAKPFKAGSGLAATGGGVGYRDGSEALIDSVGWGTANNGFQEGTAVGAPSATQSAARTHDGVDTNNNLADFSLGTPTPGAAN